MDLDLATKRELMEARVGAEDPKHSWEDPSVGSQGGSAFWDVASGSGALAAAVESAKAEEACDSWEDEVSWEDVAVVDGGPISAQIALADGPAEEINLGAGGCPVHSAEKGKRSEGFGVEAAGKELQGLRFEDSTEAGGMTTTVLSSSSLAIDAHPGGPEMAVALADESKERGAEAGASEALGQESKAPCGSVDVTICDMPRDESWVCAICHESIRLAETAQIKGCEHPYCANCILQWCSYKQYPWCPQCRLPFDSLCLFKLLDGSLSDGMVEESVCLLLRAPWFTPVEVPDEVEAEEELGLDDEDEYDEDEYYRSTLRIGNRRWGENGYVRGGRIQARVAIPQVSGAGSSSGTPPPGGRRANAAKPQTQNNSQGMGRRAKRAQKREQADESTAGTSRPARQQPRERQQRAQAERPATRAGRVT